MIERVTPGASYISDIGGAALTPLDFHRADTQFLKCRDQIQGIQADRLLNGVVDIALHLKSTLAQGRIAGGFTLAISVNQHIIETGFQPLRGLLPAHSLGR